MSTADELIEDLDNLRHMLGAEEHVPKRNWGYRNHYNAKHGHYSYPSLLRLVASGLVYQRGDYFHATEKGMRAIGLTEKQIAKAMED